MLLWSAQGTHPTEKSIKTEHFTNDVSVYIFLCTTEQRTGLCPLIRDDVLESKK